MKILYLTALDELDREKCGILGKINGQINAFRKRNVEVFFGHFMGQTDFVIENKGRSTITFSASGKTTRDRMGSLYMELLEFCKKEHVSIVYIRFMSLDAKAIRFYHNLKKERIKVVIEFYSHNLELEAKKTVKRQMRNGQYFSAIKGAISAIINKKYFLKLKECVDLIVTTTPVGELYGVKTINVVNGIDADHSPARVKKDNDFDFNIISVAMISVWHGYDRVIRGISDYYKNGGEKNILYTVIGDGDERPNLEQMVHDLKLENHIVFAGIKLKEELNSYYDVADIALEMLAGFRRTNGLISSIKMAEYFVKGVPVIYAADQDAYSDERALYCYRVSNDDSAIDIDALIEFSNNLYMQNNDIAKQMHELAKDYFDWEYTMRELMDYLKL